MITSSGDTTDAAPRRVSTSGVKKSVSQTCVLRLHLRVEMNTLAGPLPRSLGFLAQLKSLEMNENRIVGSVPGALESLSVLVTLRLDLSAPRLQGYGCKCECGQKTPFSK